MKKKIIAAFLSLGIGYHQGISNSGYPKVTIPEIRKIENQKSFPKFEDKYQIKVETNYQTRDFNSDPTYILLARMLLGEAEGCSKIEKIAIAYTAINRANDGKKWNGETLRESILMPRQYSCFNKDSKKSRVLQNPLRYNAQEFLSCLKLSREILGNKYSDPTNGATHYYNPKLVKTPYWAKKLIKIGKIKDSHHIFYKE